MKNILKNCRNFKFVLIVLLAFSTITYWKVPQIFFLQDELRGFGLIIYNDLNIILRGLGDNQVFHFIPINNAINLITFHLFGLNPVGYLIIGLIIHLVNSFLVYKIGQRIIGNNYFALLAGILFVSSNSASQLVMWPVVSMNTLALTFSLLAWLTVYRYEFQKNAFLIGTFTTIFMLCALLTVEYSIGLMLFIPILFFLNVKSNKLNESGKFLIPFLLVSLVYIGIRISPFLIVSEGVKEGRVESSLLTSLIYKVTEYPFRYLGETMIPEAAILKLENFISELFTPPVQNLYIKISGAAGIVIFLYTVFTAFYKKAYKELFTILIFIFSSVIPFLIIPGVAGNFTAFPQRYLYFGITGGSLLLAYLAYIMCSKGPKLATVVINVMLVVIVSSSIFFNWIQSSGLSIKSEERKQILNVIKSDYPVLPKKIIFYTESNKSFYGLPDSESILPFQSGFGQTLLVWYYQIERFPTGFFKDRFLWEITDQGYRETAERGFGYFRDFDLLAQTVREKNLPPSSVISFRYSSQGGILTNNTEEVRGRLAGFLVNKKEIDPRLFVITPSINVEATPLMIDRKRDTFWHSEVPYATQQILDIDLRESREIAQLRVDSYNNKNQNEVGYEVSTSQDGKDWETRFYAKRYPPGDGGYVDLFFEPQMARFIRVKQVGFHQYATWVVHELQVYETTN